MGAESYQSQHSLILNDQAGDGRQDPKTEDGGSSVQPNITWTNASHTVGASQTKILARGINRCFKDSLIVSMTVKIIHVHVEATQIKHTCICKSIYIINPFVWRRGFVT